MKWFDVVLRFLPGILGWLKPTLVPVTSQIVDGVVEAEKLWGPETGVQKLAHVQHLAVDMVSAANLAHDPTGATVLVDPTTLNAVVAEGLTAGIDIANKLTKQINTPGAIVVTP